MMEGNFGFICIYVVFFKYVFLCRLFVRFVNLGLEGYVFGKWELIF